MPEIRDQSEGPFVLRRRTPEERAAYYEQKLLEVMGERTAAQDELDRVNDALREAGIEYPLGARGVRDLAGQRDSWPERAAEERESAYRAGREERDDQIRSAARRLVARIIASAHLLDVPFTDAPDRSPWTQLKLDMNRLYEAVGIKLSVGIDQPAEPSLSFCGDLDVTTVLEALVQARSAGGDLGRAAEMVLQRHPPWMGSDGRYRPAGPGQIDQPRKLEGAEVNCTCPDVDVTTVLEPPGSRTVKGLDPRCPEHGRCDCRGCCNCRAEP